MHIKDFLRGFSAGIILTSGILFIVFKCSNQISDEYVIERAKQLNMEFIEDSSFLKEDASKSDSKENSTTKEDTKVLENSLEDSTALSDQNATVTTQNSDSNETEKDVSTDMDSSTNQDSIEALDTNTDTSLNEQTVTVNITKGMYSSDVADILYELNIIEDKQEFNLYLHNNGYSSKIKIGEFVIPRDVSYEEIARIITNS